MADRTKIEWTRGDDGSPGATWSPVTGCTKVSPGCEHCYIERTPPFRMNGRKFDQPGIGGSTGVQLHPERLGKPLTWRKPRKVFVCSMADLFHDDVPDGYIARVFTTMAMAPQHTFQVLTKRPARMRSFLTRWYDRTGDLDAAGHGLPPMPRGPEAVRDAYPSPRALIFADMLDSMGTPPEGCAYPLYDWQGGQLWWPSSPLPNVWLGVSAESQQWADIRIPALLETPAAVRWVSAEPLLGPISLDAFLIEWEAHEGGQHKTHRMPGLDWLVGGGESGPGARPMHPQWARGLRDQCEHAGVPWLFKQWGEWAPAGKAVGVLDSRQVYVGSPGSGDMPWRPVMRRVGKRAADRVLDGRTHDGYPEARS